MVSLDTTSLWHGDQYNIGCSCPYCPHEYVTECESAYCNCCSKSQYKLGSLIKNEKELSALLERNMLDNDRRTHN